MGLAVSKTVEVQLTLRYPLHLGRPNGLHALLPMQPEA